jgi:hypothetical protein
MNEMDLIKRFGAEKSSEADDEKQRQNARKLLMEAINDEHAESLLAEPRTRVGWRPSRKVIAVTVAALAIPAAYAVADGMGGDEQVIKLTPETAQPAPPPREDGEVDSPRRGGPEGVIKVTPETAQPAAPDG